MNERDTSHPCESLARLLDANYAGVLTAAQRKQIVEWAGQVRESAPASEAVEPGLTFDAFSASNRERCESPQGFNHKLNSWSDSDWITALVGEVGEAANVVKKLIRVRDGIPGNKETEQELRAKLRRELGDVFVYLDLLCQSLGFSVAAAAVEVFEAKSAEIGYKRAPFAVVSAIPAPGDRAAADAWNAVCAELASHGWHEWSRDKKVSGMASACEFIRHLAEKETSAAPLGVESAVFNLLSRRCYSSLEVMNALAKEISELFSRVPSACPECEKRQGEPGPGEIMDYGYDRALDELRQSGIEFYEIDESGEAIGEPRKIVYCREPGDSSVGIGPSSWWQAASRPAPEVVHGGDGVTLREGVWVVFHKGTRYGADYGGFAAIDPEFSYVRVGDIPPAPEPPKPVLPSGQKPQILIARRRNEVVYGMKLPTGPYTIYIRDYGYENEEAAEADGWQIEVIPEWKEEA